MSRLFVLLAVATTALLGAPAALAAGAPKAIPLDGKLGPVRAAGRAAASLKAAGAARLSPSFVLSGSGVIKLDLYDSWSAPQEGSVVVWTVAALSDYGSGDGITDADGHVELTGVPEASDNGEILIWSPNDVDYFYDMWNMSWPGTGTDMDVQPGRQHITVTGGGDWAKGWRNAWVHLYSDDGSTYKYSETRVPRTGTTTEGIANPLQGEITAGAVYFYLNEGLEIDTTGLSAMPGQDTARSLQAEENGSPRIYTSNTSWDSGKPGSAVKLFFKGFPTGWKNRLSGYDADTGKPSAWGTSWTSRGKSAAAKTLKVPANAKPGRTYMFEVGHTAGPLHLRYPFQVCSLKASAATVRRGQSVKLSGVVPIARGARKRVIVYQRSTAAGQPKYRGGSASLAGWKRVGYVNTNNKGLYSKTVRPGRTTWYCVYYPKDKAGHWAAWTSVLKVTVR